MYICLIRTQNVYEVRSLKHARQTLRSGFRRHLKQEEGNNKSQKVESKKTITFQGKGSKTRRKKEQTVIGGIKNCKYNKKNLEAYW